MKGLQLRKAAEGGRKEIVTDLHGRGKMWFALLQARADDNLSAIITNPFASEQAREDAKDALACLSK